MVCLITGGAGYLGSVLSPLLSKHGASVRVLDSLLYGVHPLENLGRSGIEFINGDLRDRETVSRALAGVDAVVHLAAIVGDPACSRNPELARSVNLEASRQLIELAVEHSVRHFVFASTCSNYGRMRETTTPATEDHELHPLSLYAETKVAVEQELICRPTADMATTVLRFATLYGVSPRMRFDLTVNEFVMRMLTDRALVVYGEQFWRPYVHVADAAAAIELALRAGPEVVAGQVFNVGDTSENYRKRDLIEMVTKRTGPADIKFVARQEDPRDYRVGFERIRAALGYTISMRVPNGIDEIAGAIESGALKDFADARYYNVVVPQS
jgi:nucleoside-diphosphate-sugar epimerase